jgi:serine/threonine protein kinase
MCCVTDVTSVPQFSASCVWCNGRGILGQGTFGTVRPAKHLASGKLVAVKSFQGTDARAAALNEDGFLKRLKHPHVVCYLGLAVEAEDILLIMEQCILGTLEAHNAVWGHAMPLDLAVPLYFPRYLTNT